MDHQPRVLVVEDELLIAMDVEDMVRALGCALAGSAGSMRSALSAVRDTQMDGAVLDINLGAERVWPVADVLSDRGVPFVLTSGYDGTEIPARFGDRPLVSKPLTLRTLRAGLQQAGIIGRA